MKPSKGVIYVAGGPEKYVREAIFSAKTFKKFHPDIPVTLFTTNKEVRSRYFDQIVCNPNDRHPQKYKVKNMLDSPYDFTLYIDSDTKFRGPVHELFDFLLTYDIGLTNRIKCEWSKSPKFIDYIDDDCYNGGFLLFRKTPASTKIIERWYEKMSKIEDHLIEAGTEYGDQKALNDIFFSEKLHEQVNLRYVILPNKIYNSRPWMWRQLKLDKEYNNVKILHNHGLNQPMILALLFKIKKKLKHVIKG